MAATTPLEVLENRINELVNNIKKKDDYEAREGVSHGYKIKLTAYNEVLSIIADMKPKLKQKKKHLKHSNIHYDINGDKIGIDFINSLLGDYIVCINGYNIRMDSQRYQLFKTKGTICSECGTFGTHYKITIDKKNQNNKSAHLNLYTDDGILMTKDHIVPVSLGGEHHIDNYQPMCTNCNKLKCNSIKD